MENVITATRGDVLKASKVRLQTHSSDPNTMESFQDGGQQNMNSEHNEYPSPMEGSHMNPDINNFSPGSGEGSLGPDGMHSMPNYGGYGRSSYGMSDQHGGMMPGNVEYNSPNSQYSGQFSQNSVRPSFTGMPKPGMPPVRPGMMPPGMGMIPGTYSSNQRMMSGQGITQQSGPTPTLNQLLQTQNSGQRFPNSYGEFSSGQGKSNDLGGATYPGMGSQQGWNGSPRSMGPYTQGPLPGTPYRNQGGTIPENRRPSGMAPGPGPGGGPGYSHQSQYMSSTMAANAQRYMMGQVRPGHIPMSGHSYNQQVQGSQYGPSHSQMNFSPSMPNQSSQPPSQQQQQQHQQMYHGQQQQAQPPGQPPPQTSPTPGQQQTSSSHRPPSSHSQGPSPRQASPAPSGMADQNSNHSTSSKKSEDNTESHMDTSNIEEANGENSRETPNSGTSQSHVGVASARPSSSPVGSSGSRSNTPAPVPGAQSGSPMPPRPPSSHLEGQGRLSHSPMATQGFNQPMMPPPFPGQMGYGPGSGGKMAASAMSGGQMPAHYSQYNSQYPQGNYGRQQSMPGMPAGGLGPSMQGSYPQPMYNGPGSQMGAGPNMYNNMMSRGMQSYGAPYGPGGLGMNSQYSGFNSHMGPAPGQGPGPGSVPGPGPGQPGMAGSGGPMPIPPSAMMGSQPGMGPMGQPAMGLPQVGPPANPGIPGKGAQAAAQAALMAAANSAGSRPLTPNRGMSSSPRTYGPHGASSPNPGGLSYVCNLGNPSLNSMTNAINQITTSSVSSVPSKPTSPAGSGSNSSSLHGQTTNGPTASGDASNSVAGGGHGSGVGGDSANMMSPMSGSDTQESSSRPSSTATPGQTADTANLASDTVGSDGSGSMPSDSTSVDSGFHSALDHNEKPPSDSTPIQSYSPSTLNQLPSANGLCEDKSSHESDDTKMPCSDADTASTCSTNSLHTAGAMISVTAAHSGTTQSMATPVSSETENTGSQTSSLPFSMMGPSNSSNGPHYLHHSHHGMGYMVPPHEGPMSGPHIMQGPGIHHPSMGNMPYGMPHSSMPHGSMPNSMPHGGGMPGMMSGMPPNMPPGSMPGNMPPGSMANNMPPGSMPGNMPPCNMPPGNLHNSMPSGNVMANNSSMGSGSMPQNNCVPVSSLPDEPPEKKKKKSSTDLSKLYDMGNEVDRRPFLDKLLSFLEEKGTPITTMPSISKQPLDLYRLYFYVREKGGMVEVNKGKKWKEICTYVNIGSSASAAFTLKKNYIRYLFAFECRHDRGNVDPGPILAEMEAQLEKKREQKKRVPSPGSQGSQDAFQPPSTPNSQMMEPYPSPMPPPYMQGPEGGMGPMGSHVPPPMMMPNNMMGHPGSMMGGQPSMPSHTGAIGSGPGPAGMMGPNGMMMSGPPSVGPQGQSMPPSGMMGGSIGPQGGIMTSSTSMMGPGGPAGMMGPGLHAQNMMGPNNFVPNTMMGHGCSSMAPSTGSMGPNAGPCMPMMTPASSGSGSSTVACSNTTSSSSSGGSMGPHSSSSSSSVPLPPSSTTNSRPPTADSVSIQDPFADDLNSSPAPGQFPQRQGGNGPNSSPAFSSGSQPPVSTSVAPMATFCTRPTASPSSSAMPYSGAAPSTADRQGSEPVPGSFRRPADSFPSASGAAFPGRSENAQFPFGQPYDRERFDPSSASHPGQQFRQAQPGMMMPSGGLDPPYPGRFPGQQSAPFRPPVASEQYSGSQTFTGHGPGFGPRASVPQDQYSTYSPQPQAPPPQQQGGYPGVRPSPPVGREMSSSTYGSGPAGGSVSQYPDWNSAGTGHMTYSSHLDGHSDSYMSGREGGPWSPMQQRYSQTSGSSYLPPAPSTPPMGGSYGRPPTQRASPQAREKLATAQKLQQKSGSVMTTPQFPPKKDVVFPPDSVEAVQPQLAKRRRLTHKDIGPVEAWRLMMSLKSGLLAESTWALDTLNVLLFDDSTVAYFNLSHLPGLLEVLTEHFRASLIHIFPIFQDLELRSKDGIIHGCPHPAAAVATPALDKDAEVCGEHLSELSSKPCDLCLDKTCPNYTSVTRQGKLVKLEERPADCSVLETKSWDVFCNFTSGFRLWQKGHGDTTEHIVPCLESHKTHELLSDLCFKLRTIKCAGAKSRTTEEGETKAACGTDRGVGVAKCVQIKIEKSLKDMKQEMDTSKRSEEQISLKQGKDNHSDICDQEVHRNNFMKKLEIKTEPRDPELHRCESNDSLPPPELPAATQDKPSSEHSSTADDCISSSKEDADEKPAPDLICEGERDSCPDKDARSAPVENEGCKEGQSARPDQSSLEDDSTVEAVTVMIKEQESELEEEAYHRDDAPLCITRADQEEAGRRCVAISNIFRSLSCIPGNEVLLSGHHGLMLLLGRLLMLHHCHPSRPRSCPLAPLPKENEEGEAEPEGMEVSEEETELAGAEQDYATFGEWWWDTLDSLRENTLVILANISSHMQMRDMDQEVCMPLLDGLLHWMVCPSSCACDPLPSAPHTSLLSPQRLVLEALCKLCIHNDNVDLLLATPPFSRILLLVARLVRLLADRSQPVPREFAVVLLSRLVQGDTVAARAIALQHPAISLLIEFLEAAEQSAMAVASQQGFSVLQNNPEMMGTSLDMLRRAGSTLLCLAHVPENRKLFLHHQNRLLALVMSQILDPSVTQIISDVLFECSQAVPPQS